MEGGGAVLRALNSQRALANLATISEGVPNVLLIVLDTVRASSMSLYGALRPTTPRLAAWAERGVTFDPAYSIAPWTLPSHASMFTGVYGSQQSGDWTSRLDATRPTLAEVFRDRGYAAGGFVGNLIAAGYESGLARGFITYDDTKRSLVEVAANTTITQAEVVITALTMWRRDRYLRGVARTLARFDFRPASWTAVHDYKAAPDVTQAFLRWPASLGGRSFSPPHVFDAHAPERSPAQYRQMFDASERQDIYDGSLRYIDDQVSDLLDELEGWRAAKHDRCHTERHGEHLGEHGLFGHGNTLSRIAPRAAHHSQQRLHARGAHRDAGLAARCCRYSLDLAR